MTITPQVRLLVLLSFLASVVVMAGLFFALRAQLATEVAPTPAPAVQKPAQAAATPATPKPAAKPAAKPSATKAATQPKPATKTKAQTGAQTAAKPKTAKPVAKKAPVIEAGLPPALTKALMESRVVVAVLAVPGAELDSTVLAEAAAGSKQAGVGFVSLDVLREKTGRALAAKLGVVETPTVVVYRRPGTVFVRFQGLVDSDTVAQAAVSALGR